MPDGDEDSHCSASDDPSQVGGNIFVMADSENPSAKPAPRADSEFRETAPVDAGIDFSWSYRV